MQLYLPTNPQVGVKRPRFHETKVWFQPEADWVVKKDVFSRMTWNQCHEGYEEYYDEEDDMENTCQLLDPRISRKVNIFVSPSTIRIV
jgi:hypothetical protein